MKTKFLNLVSIFVLLNLNNLCSAQGIWEQQNPIPTAENLNDIFCLAGTSTAWAVGNSGVVFKTINGGNTWSKLNSGTNVNLQSVHFINSNTGWVAGNDGTILRTTNGGSTWVAQTSGTTEVLYSIKFVNSSNGWAVGWNSKVLRTTNGGSSWTVLTVGSVAFYGVDFSSDALTGYICGQYETIYKTTNGGISWTLVHSGPANALQNVFYINSITCWATGSSNTFKTIDGGTTWTAQAGISGKGIYFYNSNIGWITASGSVIHYTSNGGTSWTTQSSSSTESLLSTSFSDYNKGWATGYSGTILYTINGGTTWSLQSSGNKTNLQSVDFPNINTGYAVGYNGTILKTTLGGTSWNPQSSGTTVSLNSVVFTNENTGWIAGANGTILSTTNGGTNWNIQSSTTTNSLSSLYFISSTTGWAAGSSGTILKTLNGGATWVAQTSNTTSSLRKIFFINSTTGWAVGSSGTLLKTTNGGSTWNVSSMGTSNHLYSVFFITASIGWTVGYNVSAEVLYKTTDGGATWTAQTSGYQFPTDDVYFTNSNTGFICGYKGRILKTTDGGTSWTLQNSTTSNELRGICFTTDAKTGWVVGDFGTIVHYTDYSPTIQAANLVSNSITYQSLNISWSRGNGNQCAVFAIQSGTGSCTPDVDVTYLPNATFGLGDQIGSTGWYCVYNGTGTSASINGLQPNTSYRFQVCEYNFSPDFTHYNSTTATNNPLTATTAIAPPQITGNPSASTKCETSNTSFSVTASGSALSYQWKENSGANITNGVVYSGATTATLNLTGIPANLNGIKYYCVVSNTSGSVTSGEALLTVNPLPVTPGEITGDQIVCRNTGYTYFVPVIQNATSYEWTFPTGFAGNSTTNSINLATSSNSIAGIISVKGKNACGSGPVKNFSVSVRNLPANASSITGSDQVCTGSINIGYNTAPIADAEYYIWSLPLGSTGTSLINSIMVSYGATPLSDQITVRGHNMCGDGVPSILPVNVRSVPSLTGSVSGTSNVCKNQQGVQYSITVLPEATSYLWSLPPGVTGSNSSNSVSLSFGPDAFSGDLKVSGVNSCGTGPEIVFPVIVDEVPAPAGTISGLITVCRGQTNVMYSIPQSERATYYVWDLPDGSSETTVTSKIVLNFSNIASPGTLYVTPFNSCGAATGSSLFINVPVPPALTINAAGPVEFCDGGSVQLSAGQVSNVNYQWLKDGGSVGENTYIFTARESGTYSLTITNTSGCSAPSTNSVAVKVSPAPSVSAVSLSGATKFCEGGKVSLSVTQVPDQFYSWRDENGPVTGAVNSSYDAIRSGNYRLEVSNSSGCMVQTESVNVVVGAIPSKPMVDPGRYSKGICLGETPLKLGLTNVTEAYTYQWFRNGAPVSNSTFIEGFLDPGYYYVQAQLGECSKASDSLNVVFKDAPPKPLINAKGPTVWYLTSSITNAAKYKWYYNGKPIPGAEEYLYIANQKLGKYNVSISNDKTCFTISDTITIPIGITGIEDTDPFTGIKIYPNPTPGLFTIEMDNNVFGELIIDIFTQTGSKALNIKFDKTTEHFQAQIDLSGQSKGMYLINLSIDSFKAVRKVLVE